MGKSLEREYGAAALATGGSIQATIDTRRTPSNTLVSGLTETTKTAPDIGYSLRWHDPDRFNGFDLSPLNAGTPVASWFAAKAVELSMEIRPLRSAHGVDRGDTLRKPTSQTSVDSSFGSI
jgi:hypothetical protein